MTIERLEQYRAKQQELKMWERELSEINQRVTETVKGSSRSFPYTEHTMTVEGVQNDRMARIKRAKFDRRRAELVEELEIIDAWLDALKDSRLKQACYLHYVKGLNWDKTARAMHYNRTTIMMFVKRSECFENHSKCDEN